jgi:hypothetical protein
MYYLINNGRKKFIESVIHDPADVAREITEAAARSTSGFHATGSPERSTFGKCVSNMIHPSDYWRKFQGTDRHLDSIHDIDKLMNSPSSVTRAAVDSVYGEIELKSTPIGRIKRRQVLSEETGHSIDIGRALSGDPRIWIDTAKRASRKPLLVTIVINNAANCNSKAVELAIPVAAASVLSDRLDNCGVRTEIYTVADTRGHNPKIDGIRSIRCVKKFEDASSRYIIAARSGPQSFRTVDFLIYGSPNPYQNEWDVEYHLGTSQSDGIVGDVITRHFPENNNRRVIVMPNIRDKAAAVKYVNDTVKELVGE